MLTGIAMMAFMHLYMKYTNPLLIQSILPVKSALEQKVVRIHVFGQPASGELKRPFKVTTLFGTTNSQAEVRTEKNAIEHTGKTEKAGIKQE